MPLSENGSKAHIKRFPGSAASPWLKPLKESQQNTPPTSPSFCHPKRMPVPSALRQTGQALSITLLLPLHRHFQKIARSVIKARPDYAPCQPQFPYAACASEMNCNPTMRLSGYFIVRAVLPVLPLFWKWPCIFITFSYLILNNIKNETTKAPKRSSIRP